MKYHDLKVGDWFSFKNEVNKIICMKFEEYYKYIATYSVKDNYIIGQCSSYMPTVDVVFIPRFVIIPENIDRYIITNESIYVWDRLKINLNDIYDASHVLNKFANIPGTILNDNKYLAEPVIAEFEYDI